MQKAFSRFAAWAATAAGSPYAFALAAASVVAWACFGPMLGYSEVWQLTINTGTTIVTFLMVFLIQNAQNRDTQALHLKLDEVIRALDGARNAMMDLEDRPEDELREVKERLTKESAAEPEPSGASES